MADPKLEQLSPKNCQLILIDHQPQMAFGVQSIDRQMLKNNVVGLAKAARVFDIPATISTVETESFSGHTHPRPSRAGARSPSRPRPLPRPSQATRPPTRWSKPGRCWTST